MRLASISSFNQISLVRLFNKPRFYDVTPALEALCPEMMDSVSCYVSKKTGRVSRSLQEGSLLRNLNIEEELDKRAAPPIYYFRSNHDADVRTVFTRIERESAVGGRATTKRRRISQTQELKRGYAHLEFIRSGEGYGTEQIFQLASTASSSVDELVNRSQIEMTVDASPGLAQALSRNSRFGRKQTSCSQKQSLKQSDEEMLQRTLQIYRNHLVFLSQPLGENPYLRCKHWSRDSRSFAIASACLKSEKGRKGIVAVLWQTKSRPKLAVCVSLSVQSESETLIATCSCCHILAQNTDTQDGCYHAQACLADVNFTEAVSREIKRRERIDDLAGGDNIFGKCIDLQRFGDSSNYLTVFLERSDSKAKDLTRPWIFFIVFDVDLELFVPVFKVKGKAFKCLMCRGSSARRGTCGHEDGSKAACKKVEGMQTEQRDQFQLGFLPVDDDSDSEREAEDETEMPEGEHSDNDVTGNQSVRVCEKYTPFNVRRSILPCRGEWKDMEQLGEALDTLRLNEILVLDEKGKASCHKCGRMNKKPNQEGYAREVGLFTLGHGTHTVRVYDWWCDTCQEKIKFSGRGCGVFPARQRSAYTIELMYAWLQMTCGQGDSFRNAYATTRLFGRTPSIARRIRKSTGKETHQELRRSRRRANDAFREFLRLLDTNSPMITNTLFSCKKCEVPLSAADCEEMGISQEKGKTLKRLKAVVIDGTSAGILSDLPDYERNVICVPSPKPALSSLQKLVKKGAHRKVFGKLFEMTRECLRKWKRKSSNHQSTMTHSLGSDYFSFWVRNPGKVQVNGVEQQEKSFSEKECNVARLFLSDTPCVCPPQVLEQEISDEHIYNCNEVRKAFLKAKEHPEVVGILSQVFSVTLDNAFQNASGFQVLFPFGEDTFVLNHTDENNEATDEDDEDEGDDGSDEDPGTVFGGQRLRRGPATRATLLLPNSKWNTQFNESVIALLEFLLLDHIAMPYVGRISLRSEQRNSLEENASSSMMKFTEKSMKLHSNLISAMDKYISCIHFLEQRRQQKVPRECECLSKLKKATVMIIQANPILGTFCQNLLKLKRPLHIAHSGLVTSIIELLGRHMDTAKKYFVKLEELCSEESKRYWDLYGNLYRSGEEEHRTPRRGQTQQHSQRSSQSGRTQRNGEHTDNMRAHASDEEDLQDMSSRFAREELEEALRSGICFPGRRSCRPCIIFNNTQEACRKYYKCSKNHSPGLLTVQCACDSPKLIGFIVMIQVESTAIALSAILSHFRIPPRTVYYDNACNLFLSVMLRVPWLLEQTRLAVDRFHFKSHTCSAYFDPDSYREFDTQHTETAESINARIEKTLNQIRHLSGDNLISFLRARFSLTNLAALYRAKFNKKDLEDEDLINFFQQTFHCDCESCKECEE